MGAGSGLVCKGMGIGVVMGLIYCLSLLYTLPRLGARERAGRAGAGEAGGGVVELGSVMPWEMQQMEWLLAMWEASPELRMREKGDLLVAEARRELRNMTGARGPHLEDCAARAAEHRAVDERGEGGEWPVWGLWKGRIRELERREHPMELEHSRSEDFLGDAAPLVWEPFPPWVEGADEDNLPMTRRAQRDLWLLQHPRNCSDESVRFLVASWTNNPKHGFGAQIHHMQGMFAVAIEQKRVLVTHDFDFAGHPACRGKDHNRWSCYFVPETPAECREKAYELMGSLKESRLPIMERRVLLDRDIPPNWDIWMAQPPLLWGKPWEREQPTTEAEGRLLTNYKTANVRWWRAQAIRYMMRYESEHTCILMNRARHEAFGVRAAANTLRVFVQTLNSSGVVVEKDMEKWVWSSHKPWVPRPLLSVHVRMGDKGSEMKIKGFSDYMALAQRLRNRFPHIKDIWLSSEMQEVIEKSCEYPGWNFYYTKVPRQSGHTSMGSYLKSLGKELASSMTVVNFLMAADADYFVGALGSTWCYLIDGMRSTGGKHNAGYLSVNLDRHWR